MKTDNIDTLNKIYNETLGLIMTYGVKGWTMDTVCKKSGVAKDTLYRIIGNKEELLKSVIMQALDEHNHKMKSLLHQDQDFFAALRDITTLLSVFLSRFPLEKLGQIFLAYPSIEKAINKKMEDFFVSFELFLNQGKKSGYIKENVNAALLIEIIHTCIMQFLKKPEIFNATEDIKSLLDYLIEGIKS